MMIISFIKRMWTYALLISAILLVIVKMIAYLNQIDDLNNIINNLETDIEKLNNVIDNRDFQIDTYEKQISIMNDYVQKKANVEKHFIKVVNDRETVVKNIESENDSQTKKAKRADFYNGLFGELK